MVVAEIRISPGQTVQDNSRSPQMFTSIFRRIFVEARSKRVWSISSTFEYDLFPSVSLSFSLSLSLSLSLPCSRIHVSSAISCSGRGNETTLALLDLFARAAKRAEKRATRETSRAKANRETKEENERNRNIYMYVCIEYMYMYRKREKRGMRSFEKCWVK